MGLVIPGPSAPAAMALSGADLSLGWAGKHCLHLWAPHMGAQSCMEELFTISQAEEPAEGSGRGSDLIKAERRGPIRLV